MILYISLEKEKAYIYHIFEKYGRINIPINTGGVSSEIKYPIRMYRVQKKKLQY